jgi:hypothetical protein
MCLNCGRIRQHFERACLCGALFAALHDPLQQINEATRRVILYQGPIKIGPAIEGHADHDPAESRTGGPFFTSVPAVTASGVTSWHRSDGTLDGGYLIGWRPRRAR